MRVKLSHKFRDERNLWGSLDTPSIEYENKIAVENENVQNGNFLHFPPSKHTTGTLIVSPRHGRFRYTEYKLPDGFHHEVEGV